MSSSSLNENPLAPSHLPAVAGPPVDPQLRADILHLFDVNHLQQKSIEGGRMVLDSLRPMLLKSLPDTPSRDKIIDAYVEKLLDLFKSDAYIERVLAVYAKYFSDDDVKGLTQFYETPAGQHYNQFTSQLLADLNHIGQQLALENVQDILKQLCTEYPELEGPGGPCPNAEPPKKSLLLTPNPPPAPDATHGPLRADDALLIGRWRSGSRSVFFLTA